MIFFNRMKQVEKFRIGVADPTNAVRSFSKDNTYSDFQKAAVSMATALENAFTGASTCCQNVRALSALLVGELLHSHLRALAKKRRDLWFNSAVDWRDEWVEDGSHDEVFFAVDAFTIGDLLNFPQILQQVRQRTAGKSIKPESLAQMQVFAMFATILFESLCGLPEQYIAMSTDYYKFSIDLTTLEKILQKHFQKADSLTRLSIASVFRCNPEYAISTFASKGNGLSPGVSCSVL